ncbi:MAG: winged helix-turn-helix transcriptional regulator [Armatimonadetes bacterium]|nr:winged helix-turn-helix transcriptional regulator [Armatimonadota bacterium]
MASEINNENKPKPYSSGASMNPESREEVVKEIQGILPMFSKLVLNDPDDPAEILSPGQLRLVRFVMAQNCTITEIARALKMTVSAATQAVNRLEDLGILEKVVGIGDRRRRHVRLSKCGREMMRATSPSKQAALALAGLREDEIRQLSNLIRKTVDGNESSGRRPA